MYISISTHLYIYRLIDWTLGPDTLPWTPRPLPLPVGKGSPRCLVITRSAEAIIAIHYVTSIVKTEGWKINGEKMHSMLTARDSVFYYHRSFIP